MTTSSPVLPTSTPQVPRGRAGWWHEYVCPVHGTELRAGPHGSPTSLSHTCRHGCVLVGEPYDGAWRVLELQRCAREVRVRAHTYAETGEELHRQAACDLLTACCEIYAEAVAGGWTDSAASWMLRGKLFHQALTEAIWGSSLAYGVLTLLDADERWARSSQDLQETADLFAGLLSTVTEARRVLVEDREDERNNYTAWLLCAGISSSQVLGRLGRPTDVDPWLAGLWSHVDVAVHDDGWEWEASTYYHYFVLRAYLLALRGRVPAELPPSQRDTLVSMLQVLVDLATDGGVVPVLHDGPYRRPQALQELLEVCVLGRQLVELPGLEHVEDGTRAELGPAACTLEDHLGSWFSGPALPAPPGTSLDRASVSFADAGHLVVRSTGSRWQAVVDAGPHGGAHGHLAKLALYLYGDREVWQPAPGVPPYGSALRHDYYARTVAHPSVRIDGQDQAETSGRLLLWQVDAGGTRAVTSAPGAFDGVDLQRHLLMQDGVLLDVVHVRCATDRSVVLALRPAGHLEAAGQDGLFRTTWQDGSAQVAADRGRDLHGAHAGSIDTEFTWTPVRGPSDDPGQLLGGVDWSARGEEVWFVSVYEPVTDPSLPPPGLRIVGSGADGIVVEATSAHGRTSIHHFAPVSTEHPSSGAEQGNLP